MQKDNTEQVLSLLFEDLVAKYELLGINPKGFAIALKAAMSAIHYRRMMYVLETLPTTGRTIEEESLLKDYREEVKETLIQECLFITKDKILHVVRRPEILESYNYIGRTYLAISERTLLSGKEGELRIHELAEFQYLPKPNKTKDCAQICNEWDVEGEVVTSFLEKYFEQAPHKEQRDIFFDRTFNLLKYTHRGSFGSCVPGPSTIPTIYLRKGKTKNSPIKKENKKDLAAGILETETQEEEDLNANTESATFNPSLYNLSILLDSRSPGSDTEQAAEIELLPSASPGLGSMPPN